MNRKFIIRNCKHLRYLRRQHHLKYETPPPCNVWIYHFHSLIYYHVTIKYYVLPDTIPSQYFPWAFDFALPYQLSADFYVNCSILCNIEYHFQRWCPYTCAISQWLLFQALPLFSDSFDGVYSTPFLLVTTLTVSSCYFISLSLKKVTKVCLVCIYSCILSSLKIHRHLNRSTFTLLTFLISVFTLCKMCFRMIVFTLFVYKVSLKYYRLFYNTQHGSLS